MPPCKTCNTKFHACSSCCLDHEWESDYCSRICYEGSAKYKDAKQTFSKIWRLLTPEECQIFERLQEIHDAYPAEIADWKQTA